MRQSRRASHPQAARAFGRDHLFGAALAFPMHLPDEPLRAQLGNYGNMPLAEGIRETYEAFRSAHSARAVEHARAGVVHETALIVGAGSGLSASLARLFAKDGMRVALAARDTVKLASLAKETSAFPIACDVTDSRRSRRCSRRSKRNGACPTSSSTTPVTASRALGRTRPEGSRAHDKVTGYAGFWSLKARRSACSRAAPGRFSSPAPRRA